MPNIFHDLIIPPGELLFRFVMATLLGGIIGWTRETHDKPAGLRTHMLVSLGSAAFMILGVGIQNPEHHPFDPLRVLTGIITGIGFLGAGSIIQSRGEVQGVTTAAGIWLVAAIGAMTGAGAHLMAILTTLFGYIIMVPLAAIETRFLKRPKK